MDAFEIKKGDKYMSHMALDDRVTIQEGLDNNLSIRVIAKMINKQSSTVLREINKRRVFKGARYEGALPPCKRRDNCEIRGLCKDKRC